MSKRQGFTLIEIMISVTILVVIMGLAVQFMRRQTNAVTMETQRMNALQNAAFAATQVERELREVGSGVADVQPMIVLSGVRSSCETTARNSSFSLFNARSPSSERRSAASRSSANCRPRTVVSRMP